MYCLAFHCTALYCRYTGSAVTSAYDTVTVVVRSKNALEGRVSCGGNGGAATPSAFVTFNASERESVKTCYVIGQDDTRVDGNMAYSLKVS